MKIVKVGVILGTIASATMACLWVLDLVPGQQAAESLKRILGVVAILTGALFVIFMVAGREKPQG